MNKYVMMLAAAGLIAAAPVYYAVSAQAEDHAAEEHMEEAAEATEEAVEDAAEATEEAAEDAAEHAEEAADEAHEKMEEHGDH